MENQNLILKYSINSKKNKLIVKKKGNKIFIEGIQPKKYKRNYLTLTYKNSNKFFDDNFLIYNRQKFKIVIENIDIKEQIFIPDEDEIETQENIKLKLFLLDDFIILKYMFYKCTSLVSIKGLENLNISKQKV